MIKEIIPRIEDKKLILFGEVHGTKEIPEMLSEFFNDLAKKEDFNLCLEISEEFQDVEPGRVLSLAKETDTSGLVSGEYIELIKKIPENVKVFFIAPSQVEDQEEMERGIADNLLRLVDDKRTFVILGSVHASKNKIVIGDLDIMPAGFLIRQKLGGKMFSVLLKAKSGKFFNNGPKEVTYNENDPFDKNFDYVYALDRVSACSN